MTTATVCSGGGTQPRCLIDNDWWVGTTAVCNVCGRTLKATKAGTVPRHKDYSKRETP